MDERVTGGGHSSGLETVATEEHDLVPAVPPPMQLVGHGQRRIHMASGPGRSQCEGHLAGAGLRAMLSNTPTAAMFVTSALPPNDMNGRGIPVIGISAVAPPMLMTA